LSKSFYQQIVVAINGTQASIHAAMYAIMMAKTYKIPLTFVYVVDTATIKYLSMNKFLVADERMNLEEHLLENGKKYLKHVEALAVSKGLKVQTQMRTGGVYSEIIQTASELNADLIIIGGKGENKNALTTRSNVSSVEKDILIHSKIPVLVVQKEKIEEEFKIY